MTIAFADIVPDISAYLQGCPSLVVERTARKIATDFCQRAKAWTADMTPITLVPGTHDYNLVSPLAYAEPTDVVDAYIVKVDGTKVSLRWAPFGYVRSAYPAWPQEDSGQPAYLTATSVGQILLAPVPDEAATLYVRAAVRPTADAVVWEQWLYDEFKRVIFHGVLHELLLMPARPWTDEKAGMYHGKQWTFLLNAGRDRANRGYNVGSLSVEMRPFA